MLSSFYRSKNFKKFIKDFNKLPLRKKKFIIPLFYNYNLLFDKTINILQTKNYKLDIIFDNTVSKDDEGFLRFYFPSTKKDLQIFGIPTIDLGIPDLSLEDSLPNQQLGLQLTPYKSSKNHLETYCHEIIHSIDYMLGVIIYDKDSYLSSIYIPDDTKIDFIPPSIFSFFSSYSDYKNLVNHNEHGKKLYQYGALMDLMSIFSLGDFFSNYYDKKDSNIPLNKKVNYGHNQDTFFVGTTQDKKHNIPSITTEQIADYICMKIFSPKAYKIFKKEYPKKISQYNNLISIMKKYIISLQ